MAVGSELTETLKVRPVTMKRLQAEKLITDSKSLDDALQVMFRELETTRKKKREGDMYGMLSF
jgi:hypothetical protein